MVSDPAVAEEIVQDTFVKLWIRRSYFEKPTAVKAFLYIATKNACLNHLKSPRNRYVGDIEDVADVLYGDDRDLLTQMIHAELVAELYRELQRLPEQYARIFRMTYFEEKTTEEICASLDISPNAVFTARSKATKLLRRLFKEKDLWLYLGLIQLIRSSEDLWH